MTTPGPSRPTRRNRPRNRPFVKDASRYKTVLCDKFVAGCDSCPYGLKCQYAHGEAELRPRAEKEGRGRAPCSTRVDHRQQLPSSTTAVEGFTPPTPHPGGICIRIGTDHATGSSLFSATDATDGLHSSTCRSIDSSDPFAYCAFDGLSATFGT